MSTSHHHPTFVGKKHHVHVDNPLSAMHVLNCCRKMGNGKQEEQSLMDYLHTLKLVSSTSHKGYVVVGAPEWESALRSEVEDFEMSRETGGMSSSVILYACEALTLLNQHADKEQEHSKSGLPQDTEDSTEFAIVASIWWILQRFQATSVTFGPLACTISTARRLSLLLNGVQVQIVEQAEDELQPDGAALCRALIAAGRTSIPPMTIQHVGAEGTTTVMVGTLSPSADTNDNNCGFETPTEADTLDSRQSTSTELSQLERPYWNVHREMSLLEANIDDMTGEQLAFASEQLMADPDCLDVWVTPILMKKGRPAHTLHCLVRNSQMQPLIVEMFQLTTTLGVRVQNQQSGLCRVALRRVIVEVSVSTQNGGSEKVRCKVGYIGPQVCSIKPEFEDCKRIAISHYIPLEQVTFEATAKAKIKLNQQNSKDL